jgi:HPt (histidine-containing phosphotransfer) domain-containing protein
MSNDIIFRRDELMARLGGDKKTTDEVLLIFIDELKILLRQLDDAIVELDYAAIYTTAHTLKGIAANVGANSLAAKAEKMQKTAGEKSNENLIGMLDDILIDASSVIAMIKTDRH